MYKFRRENFNPVSEPAAGFYIDIQQRPAPGLCFAFRGDQRPRVFNLVSRQLGRPSHCGPRADELRGYRPLSVRLLAHAHIRPALQKHRRSGDLSGRVVSITAPCPVRTFRPISRARKSSTKLTRSEQRPAQAIELPDRQHIASICRSERLCQTGPLDTRPGNLICNQQERSAPRPHPHQQGRPGLLPARRKKADYEDLVPTRQALSAGVTSDRAGQFKSPSVSYLDRRKRM